MKAILSIVVALATLVGCSRETESVLPEAVLKRYHTIARDVTIRIPKRGRVVAADIEDVEILLASMHPATRILASGPFMAIITADPTYIGWAKLRILDARSNEVKEFVPHWELLTKQLDNLALGKPFNEGLLEKD